MKRAVVLLSGGMDSATTLAVARAQAYECHALSVDYGQRHACELDASKRVTKHVGVAEHRIIKLDLRAIGGSALTGDIDVPKDRPYDQIESGIPITYVPARNTILLALALGYAETLNCFDLFIGVNAVDYSGYPDCRPEFIHQFETLANLATKAGVEKQGEYRVHTPVIAMTKAQIIREGVRLGVDFSLTHSCYEPTPAGKSCGRCDSCRLRLKAFAEAGLSDPVAYG